MSRRLRIIGGGLAGLGLGNGLAAGGEVELLEKGRYPRHKVCGEFICGVSDEDLKTLNLLEALSEGVVLEDMAWWVGGDWILECALPQKARGISRHRLDQLLAESFTRRGGRLHFGARVSPADIRAEGDVWAAGRPVRARGAWLGLKAHYVELPLRSDLEMHLGKGGYVGLSRIEGGKVNVCGLFRQRSELRAPREELMSRYLRGSGLKALAERLEGALVDDTSHSAVAGFELGWQESGADLVCLGDAHSMIPPFTGNGMSMALEGAASALPLLQSYRSGDLEWGDLRRHLDSALRQRFATRMQVASPLHKLLLTSIGARAMSSLTRGGLLPVPWLFNSLRRP